MNTQIYEEATEWLILHRYEDVNAEAKRRFDAWLRESPQHLEAYLEISTIWEDVPALNRDWNPSAVELIARTREAGNVVPLELKTLPGTAAGRGVEVESPLVCVERAAVTIPAYSARTKLLAIAATVLLTTGTGWLLYAQRGVYLTDIGEQRTLALEDGSSVELNARTKIRVAYDERTRTIELLQGQALFKVAKDPQRPFIVDSAGTKIRAVGTQFDVYQKTLGTQVTVVEGRVALRTPSERGGDDAAQSRGSAQPRAANASASSHGGSSLNPIPGELLLSAGEQILIAENTPTSSFAGGRQNAGTVPTTGETPTPAPLEVRTANIEVATAWTQQRLVFDFALLTEVAEEFNRYNRRQMKVQCGATETVPVARQTPTAAPPDADGPCNFRISGSFSSTDPTLLLRFLREQVGIVVEETANEIRVFRQSTPG